MCLLLFLKESHSCNSSEEVEEGQKDKQTRRKRERERQSNFGEEWDFYPHCLQVRYTKTITRLYHHLAILYGLPR